MFRKKKKSGDDKSTKRKLEKSKEYNFENAKWIDSSDNPFNMKILDCTNIFSNKSKKKKKGDDNVSKFFALQTYDPSNLLNFTEDDLIREYKGYNANLVYPLKLYEQGLIYKSPDLNYKWDIYLFNDMLFFLKSRANTVQYIVPFMFSNGKIIIKRIYTEKTEEEYTDAYIEQVIDYLIKMNLFEIEVPFPIPDNIDLDNKQEIVEYATDLWGKAAIYGTSENTLSINIEEFTSNNNKSLKSTLKAIK